MYPDCSYTYSDEKVLKERLTKLQTWLLKRGYLQRDDIPEMERVNLTLRDDPHKKVTKNNWWVVTLALTFYPVLNWDNDMR